MKDSVLQTNSRQDCESDQYGIYLDGVCHYYQVLKRLCIKVKTELGIDGVKQVTYDGGCYGE